MSRPLVTLALLVLAVIGLAPIADMAVTLRAGDLGVLAGARTLSLLGRTLLLGLGAAGIAAAIGAPFGYLVARTDAPGVRLLRPLGLVPLILPPLFLATTWTALAPMRGAGATVWVLGLNTFPLVALFTARAAERIDARLEEAAALVGGPRAILLATAPLLAPAIALGAVLAFVFAIHDFSVPDYVSSVGRKFNVYADEVFATWKVREDVGRSVATAVPLVALTLLLLLPALRLLRRGALASLPGDFRRPGRHALGRWRWPAGLFLLGACGAGALAPVGRLLWEAGGGAAGFELHRVAAAFSRAIELSRANVATSLKLSAAAATLATPIALILGHAARRTRFGRGLEALCILPLAVPGILFGIGCIHLWNREATAAIYDGPLMVILLNCGRYLAIPVLIVSTAVAAFDRGAEEAAELAGAGAVRRLVSIVAPPLAPALAAAWISLFLLAMRELDAAILVPAANGTAMFRAFNQIHFGRDDYVAALCLLIVFFLLVPGLLWTLLAPRREEVVV